MTAEIGAFVNGKSLILNATGDVVISPDSGALIMDGVTSVTNGSSLITDQQRIKTHSGYAGSTWVQKTFAVSTTGSTATAIATIAIPADYAISLRALVVGKKASAADTATYHVIGSASNNGGTTAETAAEDVTALETNMSTDCTVVIDDTADTIILKVTGIAMENWAWVAAVEYVMVKTSA